MLVLGIDPGAMNTGIAWIREKDGIISRSVLRLVCAEQAPFRYSSLREKLESVFTFLPEHPIAVGIEEPEHRRQEDFEGIISIIHLEGMYSVAVSEVFRTWSKVPVFPWKPREWRKLDADKKSIMEQMAVKYNVKFASDDESDALGIADYAFRLMKSKIARRMLPKLQPTIISEPLKIIAPPEEIKKP